MRPSDRIHCFSHRTGVSLELPAGWGPLQEGPGTAVYGVVRDSRELEPPARPPRLVVKTFAVNPDEPGAHRALSAAIVAAPARDVTVLSRIERVVDGQPASGFIRHVQDGSGGTALHYQLFIQIGPVICSVTGIGEQRLETTLLPVFEAATGSIRFIPTQKGPSDDSAA